MSIAEIARRDRGVWSELVGFVILAIALKAALDPFIWRYSGPVSLALLLVCLFAYLRHRDEPLSSLGLKRLVRRRSLMLLLPQTLLAFVGIMATGLSAGLIGEALEIEFMMPDPSGSQDRFGDLAGNTQLYLFWLAILWIAGPAEEIFFRGYLITRLQIALGQGRLRAVLSVVAAATAFGLGHVYYQGARGLVITGSIGITMGLLFLLYRKNLWPLMLAHALFNSLTFTAVYMQWDI